MPRHVEQKTLAYTADELFSVVADVKDYPSFVPWCTGARIHRESPQEIIAELEIGFGPFRESFTSQVTLDRPRQVLERDGRGAARAPDEFVDVHASRRQDSCGPRRRLPVQEPSPRSCGQHHVPRGVDSHDERLRIARASGPSDDATPKAASVYLTGVNRRVRQAANANNVSILRCALRSVGKRRQIAASVERSGRPVHAVAHGVEDEGADAG